MKPPELYEGREQTYLKHFFLERYLERVAYNIFSFSDEFVYVDGFSGPWRSEDEAFEDTSFIIALKQLRRVRDGLKKVGKDVRIRCFFNDNDPIAYRGLKQAVEAVGDIEIKAVCRNFEDVVPDIVDYVDRSFSLTFIDPFGWAGFGLHKIRPLLALRGEVLINFMFDYVNRFLEDPRPEIAATFDPTFGGPGWHLEVEERVRAGQSREDAILDVYRERLRRSGSFKHVTSTRILKPLAERSYFHLVYGTRHLKGLMEFRGVEKKAVDVQEQVRGTARFTHRVERTGQHELFGPGGEQAGPRAYDEERQKQLDAGHTELRCILATRQSVKYETLLGSLLEMPLVWESDVKGWLKDMRAAGEIGIPALTSRERTPKRGHVIHWKGQPP